MNEKFYPIYNIWTFFISIVIILQPEDVEVSDNEQKAKYILHLREKINKKKKIRNIKRIKPKLN